MGQVNPQRNHIFVGKCEEVLRGLPENSVDSVVCDPPYELGFMSKSWDSTGIAYSVPMWREVLRVLKPGGHLLAFGGTRTYHRMACAIEDAGFEVRDQMQWLYGQEFPKSLNVSKAIDGLQELSRELSRELLPAEAKFCAWIRDESGLSLKGCTELFGGKRFFTGVVEITNTATAAHPRLGRRSMVPTSAAWTLARPLIPVTPPSWVEKLVKNPPQ